MKTREFSSDELLQVSSANETSSKWLAENVWQPFANGTGVIQVHDTFASKAIGTYHVRPAETFSVDWGVQTLSGAAGAIVPFVIAGKATGLGLRAAGESLGLHGAAARLVTNETLAQVAGAGIYTFAQKPIEGQSRLANAAGTMAGFAVFSGGNALLGRGTSAIAESSIKNSALINNAVASALGNGAGRFAVGAVGGLGAYEATQLVGQIQGNTHVGNWNERLHAMASGGFVNFALPVVREGANKLIDAYDARPAGRGLPIDRDLKQQQLTHPELKEFANENPLARVKRVGSEHDARARVKDNTVVIPKGEGPAKLAHELSHLSLAKFSEPHFEAIAKLMKTNPAAAEDAYMALRANIEAAARSVENRINLAAENIRSGQDARAPISDTLASNSDSRTAISDSRRPSGDTRARFGENWAPARENGASLLQNRLNSAAENIRSGQDARAPISDSIADARSLGTQIATQGKTYNDLWRAEWAKFRENPEFRPDVEFGGLRSVVKTTEKYEAWMKEHIDVVGKDLKFKHAELASDPFRFLRGTYYRWLETFPAELPELASAPRVKSVGDLHVSQFSTWRDSTRRQVWGVNDFDEAGFRPYTNDLVRLVTSARLMNKEGGLEIGTKDAAKAVLDGYTTALKERGGPIAVGQHPVLRKLVAEQAETPKHYWDKLDSQLRPMKTSDVPKAAREALEAWLPRRDEPITYGQRQAGVGSLGRERFVAIQERKGNTFAAEAKAFLPSADHFHSGRDGMPFYMFVAKGGPRSADPQIGIREGFVVRRLGPEHTKVDLADVAKVADESRLLWLMGYETANIHMGTKNGAHTILKDLAKRDTSWLADAAKTMAKSTNEDFKDWKKHYKD